MRPFLENEFGNPSSSHWYGIRPKRAVEAARRQVAALLGCMSEEVFFTSGGTDYTQAWRTNWRICASTVTLKIVCPTP